jgi:E3 ubiquitin-protein ligase NEDD4
LVVFRKLMCEFLPSFPHVIGAHHPCCSDDWSKFTDYRGYETTDQVIKWFWQCIRSWPAEKKARLLQFATGTSSIPVNGFKDLQGSDGPRRFTIEKSGDPSQLPKSHTCFNRVSFLQFRIRGPETELPFVD